MKETVNVNIASVAFTLDQDAYRALDSYLNDIRRRLPEDDKESFGDIEARLAEIFRERVTSPMRVVTLEVVRSAMKQMGAPSDFGTPRDGEPSGESTFEEPRRIYRSRTDRSIGGVCGGLAEYFDTDATLLRVVTLLLIVFGGLSLWVYIILWIVIPKKPLSATNTNKNYENTKKQ